MKSLREPGERLLTGLTYSGDSLWAFFKIPTRRAFVNITAQLGECLKESGVKEGLALVNTKHIYL